MRTKAAKNGLQGKCGTFSIFDTFILKIITFFCKKHFAFDHDWQSPHKKNPGKNGVSALLSFHESNISGNRNL